MKKGTVIRTSRGGAALWLAVTGAFLLLAILLLVLNLSQRSALENLRNETTDLAARLAESEARGDSLDGEVAELRTAKDFLWPPLTRSDKKRLVERGLPDPENDLIQDLRSRQGMIPFDGVHGGTMGFYGEGSIRILDSRYVLAEFSDGHIGGKMILKYAVDEGRITWTVIDSHMW